MEIFIGSIWIICVSVLFYLMNSLALKLTSSDTTEEDREELGYFSKPKK